MTPPPSAEPSRPVSAAPTALSAGSAPTPPGGPTAPQVKKRRGAGRALGVIPFFVLLCIFFSFREENFHTVDNFINIVRQASINIVLATGMTLVILTRGIDLSVGSTLGYCAVLSVLFTLNPALSGAAVPLTLLVGAGLGAVTGLIIAFFDVPPFIVTLGTYTTLRGAAYLAGNGTTVSNPDLPFAWVGNNDVAHVPWLVVIALAAIAATFFLLNFTVLGVHVYAVGGNPQAARLTGIRVGLVLVFVYALSGLLSALGGVMSAARLYSAQGKLGEGYELDAIAAVILGGTSFSGGVGTITGTLFGALVISVLNNGLTIANVSFFWQLVVKGLVIVGATIVDRLRTRGARA